MSGWLAGTPLEIVPGATLAGLVAGLALPLLGVWVVLQRVVFLGVALAQVAAAGVALGLFLHWPPLLSGLAACVLMAAAFTRGGRAGGAGAGLSGRGDSALGAAFCAASAASLLFVSRSPVELDQVHHLLHGNLIYAAPDDVTRLATALAGAVAVTLLVHRRLLLSAFDPETAAALGVAAGRWLALLFGVLAVALTFSMQTTGSLLSFSLLVLPPLAALQWRRGMVGTFVLASLIGGLGTLTGLLVAVAADLHLESTITLATFALLVVSWTWGRHPLLGAATTALAAALLASLLAGPEPQRPALDAARHAADAPFSATVHLDPPRDSGPDLLVDWTLDLHVGLHATERPRSLWLFVRAGDALGSAVLIDALDDRHAEFLDRRGTLRVPGAAGARTVDGQVWSGPPDDVDALPVEGARVRASSGRR